MDKLTKEQVVKLNDAVDSYVVEVAWSARDKAFVACLAEYPKIIGRHPALPSEALQDCRRQLAREVEKRLQTGAKIPEPDRESLYEKRAHRAELRTFLKKLESFILADLRSPAPEFDWKDELTELFVDEMDSRAGRLLGGSSDEENEDVVVARVYADEDDAKKDPAYAIEVRLGISHAGWGMQSDTEWSDDMCLHRVPFQSLEQLRRDLDPKIVERLDALPS